MNFPHPPGEVDPVGGLDWENRVSAVFFDSRGVVPDTRGAEWGQIAVQHPNGDVQLVYVDFTNDDDPTTLPSR